MDIDAMKTLNLNSITESIIRSINLHPTQAQITRAYNVSVSPGHTKVTISHLSNVVDHSSVRVEGRGSAIMKGVTAFKAPRKDENEDLSSPVLNDLEDKRALVATALDRAEKARKVIGSYMDNITVQHLDVSKLGEAMDVYDLTDEKWETRVRELKKEISTLDEQIKAESDRLVTDDVPLTLRTKVVIDFYAEHQNDLEIVLIYAVSRAHWSAEYDIRVDMQAMEAPVKLTYKALISQSTGEEWSNAPLTLETARPTSGIDVPVLMPWNIYYPGTQPVIPSGGGSGRGKHRIGLGMGGAKRHRRIYDENDLDFEESYVTSKGNINATFCVPGLTTFPSSEEERSVTIADLNLPAAISWLCIPKLDSNVYIEARMTNESMYTLVTGPSNIYVDQSFISRCDIPDASPKEILLCSLGVDPSIRVTYHPRNVLVTEAGFYTKSKKHSFSQRITVHNTKSTNVEGVKIRDSIPVSQDGSLMVNLITPSLTMPLTSPKGSAGDSQVSIADGIIAQWTRPDGTDGSKTSAEDSSFLPGQDGMVEWVCSIPAFGRINLLLEWEISSNPKVEIVGLDGN